MDLSRQLLKDFADVTRGVERDQTQYLRGTIKGSGEAKYVRIDGSETLTPISEVVDVQEGDRVLVTIENHEATILGNLTKPPSAYKEQEAIDKAEDAQNSANAAGEAAEDAKSLAQSAGNKADAAVVDATNASASANQAKQDAAAAMTAAENASKNSTEAKDLATAAGQNAATAREEAAAAQNAATAAQGEVTRIQGVVTEVKGDIDTALQEVADQAADLQATKETLEVTYAKKTEVSDVQAALTTEISKKVGELQTTVSQTYAAKNDVVEMEGRLQTQITQTAGEVTSVVGKVEQLESDTTEAQKKVNEALEKSAAAQTAADQAQANATASQAAADAAKADAATATQKANEAAQNAVTAAATAAEADKKVAAAQTDLNEAKQNLANTMNRVDATEADIAEAQQKVETAQAAVTQAQEDAAEATLAANNAQTAANQAQNDATEAQNAATNAQKKADNAALAASNAQAAANKAQQDVAALTKRVTSAETAITQNAEQIKLSATKTEEIGNKLDNLKVGGENLFLDAAFRNKVLNSSAASSYIPGSWMAYNNHSSYQFGKYDNLVNYLQFTSADKANLGITQFFDKEILQPGKEFSVRFYTMCETADYNISVSISKKFSNGSFNWYFLQPYEKIIQKSSYLIEHKTSFTIPENDDGIMYAVTLMNKGNTTSNGHTIKMVKPKLEEGNTYTDFSISTKDMATQDDLTNNYYSKTETEAAISVMADGITQTVSSTYATKGNTIKTSVEEFYQSTSPTSLSGGSWSTTQPTWSQGKYIWRRTKNTYGNDSVSYTPSTNGVCITGNTGATGAAGQNGKGVSSYSVTYQAGTSGTTAPTGTWTTTIPSVPQGKYLWTKMVITYTDETSTTSYSVSYIPVNGQNGATGPAGNGVSSITAEFYLSTSKTTQTGGSWSTTQPTWSPGKYVWTRNKITYTNGSTGYTSPQCSSEWEAVNNLQVGGRNLFIDAGFRKDISTETDYIPGKWYQYITTSFNYAQFDDECRYIHFIGNNRDANGIMQFFDTNKLIKGQTYSICTQVKVDQVTELRYQLAKKNPDGTYNWHFRSSDITVSTHGEWIGVKWTFTIPKDDDATLYGLSLRNLKTGTDTTIQMLKPKLEIGNMFTDFSFAPEDMATAEQAQNAQDAANEANGKADATENRVTVAESTIKQLSDSIAMLVTDSNGSSMMTQTSNGWTFNISSITDSLNNAVNNLDNLTNSVEQSNSTLNNLKQLADDLSNKTAYINMTTDEITGLPCIELGKGGDPFKVRITNRSVDFMDGESKIAYVSNQTLYINQAVVRNEFMIGDGKGFVFKTRSNGNMGLRWSTMSRIFITRYTYNQSQINTYSKAGYSGTWGVWESVADVRYGDIVKLGVLNTDTNRYNYIEAKVTAQTTTSLTCTSTGIVTTY